MRIFLSIVVAAALCGCNRPAAPLTVRLAVNDIYCTQTACSCIHDVAARDYAEVQQQLREQFGIDLQLDYYMEPYDLEKAILAGRCDGAICKPWTALQLGRKAGARFERVADILDPNDSPWLTGIIVVMADSEFQSLASLSGKRIVIGQPDAYEKHQAVKHLCMQNQVEFGQVIQAASCSENIDKLMDGLVDAAAVSDYALSAGCAVDFAEPDDFRVVGRTERLPLTSILLDANKVNSAGRERLQSALLALSAAGAPESMLSRGFVKPAPWQPEEIGQ
jgi:ABC-type phosphate/phosphonate transport system substrate-binding protein